MVDDEDMPTTLVNSTTLTASIPVAAEPGMVDVEVARGEDLSDVLTFEFVAPAGTALEREGRAQAEEGRAARQAAEEGQEQRQEVDGPPRHHGGHRRLAGGQ